MTTPRARRARHAMLLLAAVGAASCTRPRPATVDPRVAAPPPDAEAHDVVYYAQAAYSASRAKKYDEALRLAREAEALAPAHPGVVHLLARVYALGGRPDSALAVLERAARLGDGRAVETDSTFLALRDSARFAKVVAAFAANRAPVGRSEVAFEIPDPDFLPEAMAYDAADGAFYVGSLARRKVVRVARDGSVRDFAGPAGGVLRVVGVKLDAPRGRLWFASWAPGLDTVGAPARWVDHTRLFAYDVRSGARLLSLAPRDSLRPHLFNDLAVARSGDVYVTDTGHDAVYVVRAGADTLELLTRPGPARFTGPNGIALSPDERRLYVAFIAGIAVVDLKTRAVTYLPTPPDVTTANVDGLALHGRSLIAVQTMPTLERVVRFDLDASGSRVTGAETLERANPAWRKLTTGVVVGDDFYYVAESGYDRQTDDGTVTPAEGPTRFRRVGLLRGR